MQRVVFTEYINLKFKDSNMIDASLLKYMYSNTYSNMYISWLVCFMTGSSYILQQPWTTGLAKTKANIAKKSSHSYSSRCLLFKTNTISLPISRWIRVTEGSHWVACIWMIFSLMIYSPFFGGVVLKWSRTAQRCTLPVSFPLNLLLP